MSNFDRLIEFLDDRLANNYMPGFDCIVYHKNKEVFRYFNGYSDRENGIKVNGKEKYFMYSASKIVTCAAVMKAYEEGYFLFSDNVSDFFPEYRDCKVLTSDGTIQPLKREMRIQDLITMTSGIVLWPIDGLIEEELGGNKNFKTKDFVKALAKSPLGFQPGEEFRYGLSHDVLAGIVEVAVGMDFNDYVTEKIFKPLGMTNSTYRLTSDVLSSLSQQYIRNVETGEIEVFGRRNFIYESNMFDCGGAGLVSTMDDYSKFAAAMANYGLGLNGNRILNKSTVNLMRTPLLKGKPFDQFNSNPNNAEYNYAYGVKTKIGELYGGNVSSIGEFGWDGAAGAFVSLDPERGIAIVYLQHMLNPDLIKLHPRIRSLVTLALGY